MLVLKIYLKSMYSNILWRNFDFCWFNPKRQKTSSK